MIKKSILIFVLSINFVFFGFCRAEDSGRNRRQEKLNQSRGGMKGRGAPQANKQQQGKRRAYRGDKSCPWRQTAVTLSAGEKSKTRIKTITVQANSIQSTLRAMGKVLAQSDGKAIVGYTYPGRLIKLHAVLGQWVKKGAPLATLECEEVGNTKSEYLKAFSERLLAQQNYDREERLFTKEIGAKKDFLEAKTQLEIAVSSLEAAEKKLLVMGFSKARVDEFTGSKNISPYVVVGAPIDGKVVQIDAVLGAMIEPTTEIMVILNPTYLCIDAEIYEKDLAKIKTGQEVQITVPAYPAETFIGKIYYIGDIVHPETRTITVRTRASNKDFKLKPGMFADITILVEQREKAITVPSEAVLDDLDQKIIFVQEDGSFICKTVEVGAAFNGYIEIKKGLELGEAVVVEGNYQLKSKLYEETLHEGHVH
jgi:cobalt-zinc-cadmium efflux system membrane fusion protein